MEQKNDPPPMRIQILSRKCNNIPMKTILVLLFMVCPLCKAEDEKKYFLDYFKQFGYCSICTLENSDVKSEGEPTVVYRVKELFWGDPKKYDVGWNIRISALTPEYRKREFLIVGSIRKDAANDPNARPGYFIYPIQSESFRINQLQDADEKLIKWDLLFTLLKEERSRMKSLGLGTAPNK